MRVVVLSKERTDYARAVETYLEDFRRQTSYELEVLDPETPEGISFCQAYDVLEFPTVIALSGTGHMQSIWKGLPLPTIGELSYYASQAG